MRRWVFKLHSALALLALVPLVLIVLTGSLLVFKFEIDSLLMPGQVLVHPPAGAQRLPLDALVDRHPLPRVRITIVAANQRP